MGAHMWNCAKGHIDCRRKECHLDLDVTFLRHMLHQNVKIVAKSDG
jgi:hypothetical protein